MVDPSFIVALCCAKKVMAKTMVLSRTLQKVNQDFFQALQSVEFVVDKLQKWRERSETENNPDLECANNWEDQPYGAFFVAEQLAKAAGIKLVTPRISSRQTAQNNVPAQSPLEYYRRAIWFPYLDVILQSLKEKFSAYQLTIL